MKQILSGTWLGPLHGSPYEPIHDWSPVHVWRLGLDDAWGDLPTAECCLTAEELDRAARLRDPTCRRRFLNSRRLLRFLLGRCLGLPSQQVPLSTGSMGQPYIAGGDTVSSQLSFSLSRAGGMVLIAISAGCIVGVDAAEIDWNVDAIAVADVHFSRQECEMLARRSLPRRASAFFACWVIKEAVLKALHRGITSDLQMVEVTLDRDGRLEAVHVPTEWMSSCVRSTNWACLLNEDRTSPLPTYTCVVSFPNGQRTSCSPHYSFQ